MCVYILCKAAKATHVANHKGDIGRVPLDSEGVQRRAMLEHFRSTMDVRVVYAMPTESLSAGIASLDEALCARPAKRRRADAVGNSVAPERVYFRVTTHKRISLQRTVPLALGVIERLDAHDIAITLHACTATGDLDEQRQIYCEPLCDPQQPCNPSAVLSFRGRDVQELRSSFVGWHTSPPSNIFLLTSCPPT